MGDVRVRDVDPGIVERLKAQARRRGRTFRQELMELLTEAAMRPRLTLTQGLRQLHKRVRAEHGELSDSTLLIREERERWG